MRHGHVFRRLVFVAAADGASDFDLAVPAYLPIFNNARGPFLMTIDTERGLARGGESQSDVNSQKQSRMSKEVFHNRTFFNKDNPRLYGS